MSRKQPFDNPELNQIIRHLAENLQQTADALEADVKSIVICAIVDDGSEAPKGWNMHTGCACPDCLMHMLQSVASAFGAKVEASGGGSCAAETQGQVH